jgi:group I intron endonuclease
MPEIYEGNTGVYCIRNVKNGKRYVGSAAKSLLGRWKRHKNNLVNNRHCNTHLQRAWNKCGPEAFVFQILERCEPDRCKDRETIWIARLDATNQQKGYNVCREGRNHLGAKRSEETRAKHKKNWQDPGYRRLVMESARAGMDNPSVRARLSEHSRQLGANPEIQQRKSEKSRKFWADPKQRRNASDRVRKAHQVKIATESEEEKQIRLQGHKDRGRRLANDPNWKKKSTEGAKRRSANPEWQKNQLKGARRRSADPNWRKSQTEAANRRVADPEWQRKHAEGVARRWAKWRAERGEQT